MTDESAGAVLACRVCATPVVPGARFCFNCGSSLVGAAPDRPDAGRVAGTDAERRVVTVLFGDLSDFTAWAEELDPERVGAVTDRLLAALTQAVDDVGGYVDKLTGDGIMAVFGAPTAHEDDPERAVRAAAAMQRAVRRLVADESGGGRSLGLRVGVNTGEVLATVQAGHTYTVVGDTVNTAARLSDATGVGAVWAGRDTALATTGVASWRALPPLRLKGKREPVSAYELVRLHAPGAERAGLGEEAPFIGRDAERGVLVGKCLDVIEHGQPSTVVVTGEAGIGKTRLITEFARFTAEIDGSRILWGRCQPYGEGRDLGPLADWVRTACGVATADLVDSAQIAERVRRTVARVEAEADVSIAVEPLLALLGVTDQELPTPRDAVAPGAESTHESTVGAVAALMSALADPGPLLLIVDDLQWAVDELYDGLVAVARRLTGRVLLVVAGRSELLAPTGRPGWWQQLPEPELLPLVPLERVTTDRLLRAYLGGSELDPDIRDLLLDRAEGNPFFLAELLHLLIDRGLLRREGDAWTAVGPLPESVLPAGVQAVLAARFDDLDPEVRAVLRNAAVLGTRFPDSAVVVLMTAGDLDAAPPAAIVESALATLRDREILRSPIPGLHVFVHTLAREVAYAAIPKVDRAHRHAAVARWAVAELPGPQAEVDAFVGAHAERAIALADEMQLPPDDPAWAVRGDGFAALRRLGDSAIATDDLDSAVEVFGRALAIADEAVPIADVLRARTGRAAGLVFQHRLAEAEEELRPALDVSDEAVRGPALVVLGDLRRRQGDDAAAIAALEEALATARAIGDDFTAAYAIRGLGLIDYLGGRLRLAETRFDEAVRLAERTDDPRGAGWALQHLAWSATTRGAYVEAESALRRAAEVFAALDDNRGLSWCAGSEAFVRLLGGRFKEARDLASALLPLGERVGDRWGVGACLTIDAIAAAELGDPDTAAREAERACRVFDELGDRWGLAMATIATGIAARCAGETKEAVTALEHGVELAVGGSYAAVALLAGVVLGYAHLDAGDVEAAEAQARRSGVVTDDLDLEPSATVGIDVLLAQVLRARGRAGEALRILERIDAVGDQPSLLFPRRQAIAHRAGLLLELGRVGEAGAMITDAFGVPAEDVRSTVVTLRVLAAVQVAQGRRDEAEQTLAFALDAARSAGYQVEVALTESARTRLLGDVTEPGD